MLEADLQINVLGK